MPRSTRDLSDRHEDFLARLIEGRRTPGSGNQANNQADVRGDYRKQSYAFALDGKATEGKSITVRLADWEKIVEQAHDEIPGLALRFYLDGTLRHTTDLIVVEADTFRDLRENATLARVCSAEIATALGF